MQMIMNKCIAMLCAILLVWSPMVAYAEDTPPPPRVDLTKVELMASFKDGEGGIISCFS